MLYIYDNVNDDTKLYILENSTDNDKIFIAKEIGIENIIDFLGKMKSRDTKLEVLYDFL